MSIPAKIFVVDDDESVLDALALLLETAGYAVTTFAVAEAFLDACTPDTRGCLILDLKMPGIDGLVVQEELKRRGMLLPIIFLSGAGSIPVTVRALKKGAMDFLTKPVDGAALLACVGEALKQDLLLQEQAADRQATASQLEKLTDRECEILKLILAGHTSKEIAKRLDISFRTVESHRTRILHKTGAANMMELVRFTGMIESP